MKKPWDEVLYMDISGLLASFPLNHLRKRERPSFQCGSGISMLAGTKRDVGRAVGLSFAGLMIRGVLPTRRGLAWEGEVQHSRSPPVSPASGIDA